MAKIRTFIAVEMPAELKRALAQIQDELRGYRAGVSWTRPEGMHVTLKFLGNVEEGQIDAIAGVLESACDGVEALRLTVGGTGAFPSWGRPRVLWIGIDDEGGRLSEIQRRLERGLESIGFAREKRPFKPHLTLGRVKAIGNIRALTKDLRNREVALGTFQVSEIVVMKSDLKPTGAVYTPLRVVHLKT